MSEIVIKFIILSGQKIRSRILQFRVGSDTGTFILEHVGEIMADTIY